MPPAPAARGRVLLPDTGGPPNVKQSSTLLVGQLHELGFEAIASDDVSPCFQFGHFGLRLFLGRHHHANLRDVLTRLPLLGLDPSRDDLRLLLPDRWTKQ